MDFPIYKSQEIKLNRLDSNVTLSVFNSSSGRLINESRDGLFDSPGKSLGLSQNLLWFGNNHHICFLKLGRDRINNLFDSEDFKGCKIQSTRNSNSLYFLSEKKNTLWKLSCNDLNIMFVKEIEGISLSEFSSKDELICVVTDFEAQCPSTRNKTKKDENLNIINYSVIKIHCELLDNNKSLSFNKGVVELLRTDSKILELKINKTTSDRKNLTVLLADNSVYNISYKSEVLNQELQVEDLLVDQIFGEEVQIVEFISDNKQKLTKNYTVEFVESILQVPFINFEELFPFGTV